MVGLDSVTQIPYIDMQINNFCKASFGIFDLHVHKERDKDKYKIEMTWFM